jgi:hypothetical protein
MSEWFEVFRAGEYPQGTYSPGDIDQIIHNFEPARLEVPLVLGHPAHDDPAWGWVAALARRGDILIAQFQDVHPAVVEMVRRRQFKRVSVRLRKRDNGWELKHVGLLGAAAPAVEGLVPIQFGAGSGGVDLETSFTEGALGEPKTEEQIEADVRARLEREFAAKQSALEVELKTVRTAARKAEAAAWLDKQVAAGRLAPASVSGVADFVAALEQGQVDFSHDKLGPASFFRSFVESLPIVAPTAGEVAGRATDPGSGPVSDFAAPEGFEVDDARMALHRRALALMAERRVDYTTAVKLAA